MDDGMVLARKGFFFRNQRSIPLLRTSLSLLGYESFAFLRVPSRASPYFMVGTIQYLPSLWVP